MHKILKLDVTFGSQDYRDASTSAWVSAGVGLWTLWSTFLWFHTCGGELRLLHFTWWDALIPLVWMLSLLGLIVVISRVSNAISHVLKQELHRGYVRSCHLYTIVLTGLAVAHAMQAASYVHQITGWSWGVGMVLAWIRHRGVVKTHQPTEIKLRGTSL